MDILKTITEPEMYRNAPDIAALVEHAVKEGVFFPHDPSGNDGVQIRIHRSASADGHRLAAVLHERRDEVNRFFKEHRPAWPAIPDDGYGPRLNPDEPDAAIFLIRLEAILAEDAIATAIEEAVSHAQERIAGIVERAITARRTASTPSQRQPLEFRGGKVISR